MSNLQYLPPDFEKRCTAYRAALERGYAHGSLDDAGRSQLEQERKRIRLRAEDAHQLEEAYLQENRLLLLERRIEARTKAYVKTRLMKLEHPKEAYPPRLLDSIEAQMTTLKQRLEQVQDLPKIVDNLVQRLQTIEADQAALLKEIEKAQAMSANQAEGLATLQRGLQAALNQGVESLGAIRGLQAQLDLVLTGQKRREHGPTRNVLKFTSSKKIALQNADVNLRNFMVKARFEIPDDDLGSEHGWDYGFAFGHTNANEAYHLYVDSNRNWVLSQSLGLITMPRYNLQTGKINFYNRDLSASNDLRLLVKDGSAIFFVNDQYIETLKVSDYSGDVWVATGFLEANRIEDKSTRYEGFTVWSLP